MTATNSIRGKLECRLCLQAGEACTQDAWINVAWSTMASIKLPHLNREEIKAVLTLGDIELKQTRFYQEIAEEERQKGFQPQHLSVSKNDWET